MNFSRWNNIHPQHRTGFGMVLPVLLALTVGVVLAWAHFSVTSYPPTRHFLALHQALETVSIVVSALIFAVGWRTRSVHPQRSVFILASGFLGVALLDFSHMLSYIGMPDFITANPVSKGINFWLPARYLAIVSLLWVLPRNRRGEANADADAALAGMLPKAGLTLVMALVAAVHVVVFWYPDLYPQTYGPQGLTPFKIAAEYGVVGLCVLAMVLLLRRAREQSPFDVPRLFAAVWVMALSEFFFTLYVTATDVFNLLGHVYKVIGYYYLYRAIFVGTVEAPYRALEKSDRSLRDAGRPVCSALHPPAGVAAGACRRGSRTLLSRCAATQGRCGGAGGHPCGIRKGCGPRFSVFAGSAGRQALV